MNAEKFSIWVVIIFVILELFCFLLLLSYYINPEEGSDFNFVLD